MHVLALLNEKGGAGKSTLSINLATALHRQGRKVVLIDADPQGTARDWREASPADADLPPVVALDRPELLLSSLRTFAADLVIIDTPAKAERMSANVVRVAHTILIPVQPSAADVWASAAAVKLIQSKIDVGGSVNAGFVATRVSPQTKLSKEIMAGDWNEYGFPILDAALGNRVSYAQSLSDGVSVFETQDSLAKQEVTALVAELEALEWL
ncbi:MAG: ParA family partition ATPase [Flavobacteriales bacterium]